jgi:hypothetical protein
VPFQCFRILTPPSRPYLGHSELTWTVCLFAFCTLNIALSSLALHRNTEWLQSPTHSAATLVLSSFVSPLDHPFSTASCPYCLSHTCVPHHIACADTSLDTSRYSGMITPILRHPQSSYIPLLHRPRQERHADNIKNHGPAIALFTRTVHHHALNIPSRDHSATSDTLADLVPRLAQLGLAQPRQKISCIISRIRYLVCCMYVVKLTGRSYFTDLAPYLDNSFIIS